MPTRPIASSGEQIPVIGLGTSDEFDRMPNDGGVELQGVIRTLLEHGGSAIDTAPAYGNSETVVGELLADMGLTDSIFVVTKIRARGTANGVESLQRSQERLGKDVLDSVLIHSLFDVHTQLATLRSWQAQGRVRYIGISTADVRQFDEIEELINREEMDFIQLNYGVADTLAEERVIPAAADRGVAVMINSPFADGGYFGRLRSQALPEWASEFDCESWAQFSLRYILGNPAITCIIPATSDAGHMRDNARAAFGRLPDTTMRRRMVDHLQNI